MGQTCQLAKKNSKEPIKTIWGTGANIPFDALSQIKEKKYYEKYAGSPKSLHIIGVGLDIEQRNIADYKSEPINN